MATVSFTELVQIASSNNFFFCVVYLLSEPYSPSFGVDAYSPSRVFQPKQGYSDLPGCKISDLMKSSSLEVSALRQSSPKK